MTLWLLVACIISTSSSTHRSDCQLQNQTVALLEKERQKWFKKFQSSVSNLRPNRSTIYKLMLTGSLYNYWTKFQSQELDSILTKAIRILIKSRTLMDHMIADHRMFPINPFQQLYIRSSDEVKQALNPLAVKGNWLQLSEVTEHQTFRDSINDDQDDLRDILDRFREMHGADVYSKSLRISNTFKSSINGMQNLSQSDSKWITIKIEIHLSTLGLMLDVLKFAGNYDYNLEPICSDGVILMTKAAAPFLKQTHRLIHILCTKGRHLLRAFQTERDSLLIRERRGDLVGGIERDPAEDLMMKLRLDSIYELDFKQITEIMDLCTIYLFHHRRITRVARGESLIANRFALELFIRAMRFAKTIDTIRVSGRKIFERYIIEMIECIAETLKWNKDDQGMQLVEDMVYGCCPELYGKLLKDLGRMVV